MLLIADAAPIIFLAKIRQLGLMTDVFKARILMPAAVEKEILGPPVPPDEERLAEDISARVQNCGCGHAAHLRNGAQFGGQLRPDAGLPGACGRDPVG